MTLLALPADYSRPVAPVQPQTDAAPVVVQKVTVQQVSSRTDLTVDESSWGWSELRDYVVSQIERIHGAFPRDAKKEYGIFNRFMKEHGASGVLVAKTAFEVYGGWWNGAPISINRFTRGSDPYFVVPILQRLSDAQQS